MDLDDDGISSCLHLRGYDPVTVAASFHLKLPFNMIQATPSTSSFYCRRRLSLIEALNNSIQDEDCLPFDQSCPQSALMSKSSIEKSTTVPDRVYSVRQIIDQNHDVIDRGRLSMRVPRIYVKNVRDESVVPEVPRVVRARTQRRSKSQPNASGSLESDEDYGDSSPSSHISRIDCGDEWNRACRCSVQSSSSSYNSNGSSDSGMMLAEACWDHVALLPDELPFASGDVITVLDHSSQSGLWFGSCRDSQGWFPASHVRLLSSISRPCSISQLNADWPEHLRVRRSKIVEELMSTERDYVRLLEDIVQGFMEQTKRRAELFSPQRIRNIFGNLNQIYTVHVRLLRELELALDTTTPENTQIGAAFLRNKHCFSIYSEYCNNRPVSCAELAHLSSQPIYRHFLEACRLLRGLPNLSLEGFLLTPVQRICRYPLQLQELLKATPTSHSDWAPLEAAERAMRAVAANINDRKRRIEALQDIACWQRSVHGFKGSDLLETNSAMLRSGEIFCRAYHNSQQVWAKDILLFLFDQSIVICKKDQLKRHFYVFKDRMSLHNVSVVDLKDGKDTTLNTSVKNAFKLIGHGRQFLFVAADKKNKAAWLSSFEQRSHGYPSATVEEKRLAITTLNSIKYL